MSGSIQVGVGPIGYVLVKAPPETIEQKALIVKAAFQERGECPAHWADEHGFQRSDVYRVLNGYTPCKRGLTHQIAVKLGIKPDPAKSLA